MGHRGVSLNHQGKSNKVTLFLHSFLFCVRKPCSRTLKMDKYKAFKFPGQVHPLPIYYLQMIASFFVKQIHPKAKRKLIFYAFCGEVLGQQLNTAKSSVMFVMMWTI